MANVTNIPATEGMFDGKFMSRWYLLVMRKSKMEAESDFGDVVQTVGQRYHPCEPSSQNNSWHLKVDAKDISDHLSLLFFIFEEKTICVCHLIIFQKKVSSFLKSYLSSRLTIYKQ